MLIISCPNRDPTADSYAFSSCSIMMHLTIAHPAAVNCPPRQVARSQGRSHRRPPHRCRLSPNHFFVLCAAFVSAHVLPCIQHGSFGVLKSVRADCTWRKAIKVTAAVRMLFICMALGRLPSQSFRRNGIVLSDGSPRSASLRSRQRFDFGMRRIPAMSCSGRISQCLEQHNGE